MSLSATPLLLRELITAVVNALFSCKASVALAAFVSTARLMVITSGAPDTRPVPWAVIPLLEPDVVDAMGAAFMMVAAFGCPDPQPAKARAGRRTAVAVKTVFDFIAALDVEAAIPVARLPAFPLLPPACPGYSAVVTGVISPAA